MGEKKSHDVPMQGADDTSFNFWRAAMQRWHWIMTDFWIR